MDSFYPASNCIFSVVDRDSKNIQVLMHKNGFEDEISNGVLLTETNFP